MKALLVILVLAVFLPSACDSAPIPHVTSVAALHAHNFSNVKVITLDGYDANSALGGGTLFLESDGARSDDGCTSFIDAAGHPFRRRLNGDAIDLAMCGGACDGVQTMDGQSIAGSDIIVSPNGRWTSKMIGWRVIITKAGAQGTQLDSTVQGVNTNSLILASPAASSGTNEVVSIFPDDTAAFDRAIAVANRSNLFLRLPSGRVCGLANPGSNVQKRLTGRGLQLNSGTLWLGQTGSKTDTGVGLLFASDGSSLEGPGTVNGLYDTDQGIAQYAANAIVFEDTARNSIKGRVVIENSKGRAFLAERVKDFSISDLEVRDCGDYSYRAPAGSDIMTGRSMCGQVTAPAGSLLIENYTGVDAAQSGLLIYGPTDPTFRAAIRNCHFDGNGYYGLDLEEVSGEITVTHCDQVGRGPPAKGLIGGGFIARDVATLSVTDWKSALTDSNSFVVLSNDSNANLRTWTIQDLTLRGTTRNAAAIYLAFTWKGAPQRVSLRNVAYDSLTVYANSPACDMSAPDQQLLELNHLFASRRYREGSDTFINPQGNAGQMLYVRVRDSDLGSVSVRSLGADQNVVYLDSAHIQATGISLNPGGSFHC